MTTDLQFSIVVFTLSLGVCVYIFLLYFFFLFLFFFFFSSRRRHTRSLRDWSSDVCSSDLGRWRTRSSTSASGNPRPPSPRRGGTRSTSPSPSRSAAASCWHFWCSAGPSRSSSGRPAATPRRARTRPPPRCRRSRPPELQRLQELRRDLLLAAHHARQVDRAVDDRLAERPLERRVLARDEHLRPLGEDVGDHQRVDHGAPRLA